MFVDLNSFCLLCCIYMSITIPSSDPYYVHYLLFFCLLYCLPLLSFWFLLLYGANEASSLQIQTQNEPPQQVHKHRQIFWLYIHERSCPLYYWHMKRCILSKTSSNYRNIRNCGWTSSCESGEVNRKSNVNRSIRIANSIEVLSSVCLVDCLFLMLIFVDA